MKSLARLILSGVTLLSSCNSPRDLSYVLRPNLAISKENQSAMDSRSIEFASDEEKALALAGLKDGEIKEGRWKGLRLALCKRSAYSLEDFIDENNPLVQTGVKRMRIEIPDLDSKSSLEKLSLLYVNLRKRFVYEMTPFDKLDHLQKAEVPEDLVDIFSEFYLGTQTVESIHEQGRGDCEDLSILFASYARALNLSSSLVFLSYKDRPVAHVLVRDGTEEEIYIDPSLWEDGSFSKNISSARDMVNSTNVSYRIIVPQRVSHPIDSPTSSESVFYIPVK